MAETTLLRASANVRNASPQATGAGPHAQVSGAHPVVHVNMNSGGPQVSGGQPARQGVVLLPPKAGTRNFTTGGLPNQPAKQAVVISPPKDPRFAAAHVQQARHAQETQLTTDQLMLCRHLVDKYLTDARAAAGEAEPDAQVADNMKLAEGTIASIDVAMAMIAASAAAAAEAAAQPPPPPPPRRAVSVGGPRPIAASAAPRRVVRPGPPPPPVNVRMQAGQPVPVPADEVPGPTPAAEPSAPPDAQG